jgi:hypothetical protein
MTTPKYPLVEKKKKKKKERKKKSNKSPEFRKTPKNVHTMLPVTPPPSASQLDKLVKLSVKRYVV